MGLNIQERLTLKEQVNRLYDYIYLNISEEYYKLLEIAIECGMTSEEFWNGDIVMFAIYSIAYTNRLHKMAFVNGVYYDRSLQVEFGNLFAKKNQQPLQYPTYDIFNPLNERKQLDEIKATKKTNVINNKTLYYDTSKSFHIQAILNSTRKEEK